MNIEIDISSVLDDLEGLVDNADTIVSNEINKTAYKIERDAKQLCPVDTGRLKGSITTNPGHLEAEVGTNVEYAGFVEFGTRYQSAQPYIIPAFESNVEGIEDRIAGDLID